MKHLRIELGLACKNSKNFIDMLAVYLGHHLEINLGTDANPLYNFGTNTAIVDFHIHYLKHGKLRGLLPDTYINGNMRITLDSGWDWIEIDLEGLSEKDISMHIASIKFFIKEIEETNPEMFGEFNPSERD